VGHRPRSMSPDGPCSQNYLIGVEIGLVGGSLREGVSGGGPDSGLSAPIVRATRTDRSGCGSERLTNPRSGFWDRGELLVYGTIADVSCLAKDAEMRDLIMLFVHRCSCRLFGPGGIHSVVAEFVRVKQQLLILNRFRSGHPIYTLQIAFRFVCSPHVPGLFSKPSNASLIRRATVRTQRVNDLGSNMCQTPIAA
jgi:hypothetical protein